MAGEGFNKAVEACYERDEDPGRDSIRYFASPETYVEITVKQVVEALRSPVVGTPDHPDAIFDTGRRRAADFIEREFSS